MTTDRRKFLQFLSSGAVTTALSGSIARALETPAHRRNGSVADVEHIVILTQENRSFDQYFGSLRGVRGFNDPRAVTLPSGNPVWYQPSGSGSVLPFRPSFPDLGMQFFPDVPHDWTTSQAAWDNAKYDAWIPSKGVPSMIYYTRNDIPFHYALADAFTVCDAYYCSVLGPTDPNRYHMWTGWLGNDGQGGGPVVDNAEAGYDWSTYPEVLQNAGLSWKVYQDIGNGLDAQDSWGWTANPFIGNFGDNSLLYFHQYQNAAPDTPLYEGARTGTNVLAGGTLFDEFRQDVLAGRLPQVSWIAAPEAYSEHPNWPPNYGAWYISQILDALTANPDVWSKTVFFLMYDENGGFFDHMVPPTPPQSRTEGLSTIDVTDEIFPGNANYSSGPYGLGVRVPMVVISPWSKGGWVNSEVFDHTSLIQFIETRFGAEYPGLISPNITPWRRAVTGDLTSAFDFKSANSAVITLPNTSAYMPPDQNRHPSSTPVPPSDQSFPVQESGIRPARALPYRLYVQGHVSFSDSSLTLEFSNTGKTAAVYQVRSGNTQSGPWTYTVTPNATLSDTWNLNGYGQSAYDLSVYGPNGFLRTFKGSIANSSNANLHIRAHYDGNSPGIRLNIANLGAEAANVRIQNVYTGEETTDAVPPGSHIVKNWRLARSFGWYDFIVKVDSDASFERRIAGHVETGRDSMTDPAMGGVKVQNGWQIAG